MTTFKLPEPTYTNPAGKPFYTEAQLTQAVKDVLEQAVQCVLHISMPDDEDNFEAGCMYAADAIRKMIGEIK